VSQYEWTKLSAASVVAPYWDPWGSCSGIFGGNNFEDGNCLRPRIPELTVISFEKTKEKYLAFEPRTWTKCQIKSQSKLTMPKRENRKIRHEKAMLKANDHTP
jgi:hypothetical protein